MGVKTFNTLPRSTDAAARHGACVIGWERGITLSCVALVRERERGRVDCSLCCINATGGLEPSDKLAFTTSDQPEAGRHRRAIVEKRSVSYDNGRAGVIAHHDRESSCNWSAEERLHRRDVLRRRPLIGGGHLLGADSSDEGLFCFNELLFDELGFRSQEQVDAALERYERPDARIEADHPTSTDRRGRDDDRQSAVREQRAERRSVEAEIMGECLIQNGHDDGRVAPSRTPVKCRVKCSRLASFGLVEQHGDAIGKPVRDALRGHDRDDFLVSRRLGKFYSECFKRRASGHRIHRTTPDRSCIGTGLEEDDSYGHLVTLPADHRLAHRRRCESEQSSLGFSGVWTNRRSNSPTAGRPRSSRLAVVTTAALTISSLSISIAQGPAAQGATTSGLAAQATAIAGRVSADSSALSAIGERYLTAVAHYHLDLTNLTSTHQALIRTAAAIQKERTLVDGAAVEAYVASGAQNAIGLYLANQPDRTTITDTYLDEATREVDETIATLARDKSTLATEQATEQVVTSSAAEALQTSKQARDSALATLLSEQTTLSSVKGRLAELVQAQEAAAERAAEEKAAAAEEAAQAAAAAAAATKTTTTSPALSASGPPASSAVTSINPGATPPHSLAADFAAIRGCEASGDYSLNTGNGYYGAYQFAYQTWIDFGESGLPSSAPPATQDAVAYRLYLRSGWSSWPACAAITGLA